MTAPGHGLPDEGARAGGHATPPGGPELHFETIAAHAGRGVDPATGAVVPPIHLSTTFEREPDASYPRGFVYSRADNPNRAALERALARLEGGAACAAFASGQSATMSVFQALAPGDHVVVASDAYYGTGRLVRELFEPWGLAATFADLSDAAALQGAMTPSTRLVWIESPSNPLLKVTDIARVAAVARAAGARTAVDNTWATPVLQRPLALGADLVMHATTKYLGGHSDVLGGAIVAREDDAFFARVRDIQKLGGAVPSPFECWLVLRGLRTLALRVRVQSASAAAIARFLALHPAVEVVHYPGLPAHPNHAVAARQMEGSGGMLAFQVRGDRERALAVTARLRLFTRATSLGGTESLIEHRASNEHPETTTPQNLLRVSVGVEHVDDLIEDLAQALE